MTVALLRIGLCVALVAACGKSESGGAPSPSSSAALAASAPAPAPIAEATPWFAGSWQGTFRVERHQIALDPKLGGLKEWQADDGKATSGDVSVTLNVTPAGIAEGQATGALGALRGAGVVEDDKLTVQWSAEDAQNYFAGVLSAAREGEQLRGTFQGSSGNSLSVRSAKVTLVKSK